MAVRFLFAPLLNSCSGWSSKVRSCYVIADWSYWHVLRINRYCCFSICLCKSTSILMFFFSHSGQLTSMAYLYFALAFLIIVCDRIWTHIFISPNTRHKTFWLKTLASVISDCKVWHEIKPESQLYSGYLLVNVSCYFFVYIVGRRFITLYSHSLSSFRNILPSSGSMTVLRYNTAHTLKYNTRSIQQITATSTIYNWCTY